MITLTQDDVELIREHVWGQVDYDVYRDILCIVDRGSIRAAAEQLAYRLPNRDQIREHLNSR
jgi:hypothetical protein